MSQEHAPHEPLISRAMLAEVQLAGLSFGLKVRLVDGKGTALPGFDWQDCIPVRGDSVAHRIGWSGDPPLPAGARVSLDFSLHDEELYGFDCVAR